ncbi:MAG: SLBB domain-containing protein [Deltaproteobacteria bacterium]|nr:SLBB domain-containing protein [Deltaproteobacteria bacterium]
MCLTLVLHLLAGACYAGYRDDGLTEDAYIQDANDYSQGGSGGIDKTGLRPDELCREKNLTSEQCQSLMEKIMISEFQGRPDELLKNAPELKYLKPDELMKGKELIKKRRPKDEEREKEGSDAWKKTDIDELLEEEPSLFDRYLADTPANEVELKLKPFGYNLFARPDLRPNQDLPVASDYIIGPGDELGIHLWGRLTGQYSLTVSREGAIHFPNIGPLTVAGMTFEEMKKFLKRQSSNIIGTDINITMGRLRSIQVFVLGEVKKPGAYTLNGMSTVTNALMAGGGPANIGTLRRVELKRSNRTISVLDFYDLLLRGDKSKDLRLQSGDVVFVPTVGPLVGIAGNVKRPAIYELKDSTDLDGALDLAGGIIPTAYAQQIQIERVEGNSRRTVADINAAGEGPSKSFMLQDADLVKVFSIFDKDSNAVFLYGNVKRPGKFELKKGMRIKDIIKDENDLLKETYFEYGLVKRLVPPSMEVKLIPFNLGRVLFNGSEDDNIELAYRDTVYIFPKRLFEDKKTVRIEGEVRCAYQGVEKKASDECKEKGGQGCAAASEREEAAKAEQEPGTKAGTKQDIKKEVQASLEKPASANARQEAKKASKEGPEEPKKENEREEKGEPKKEAKPEKGTGGAEGWGWCEFELERGLSVKDLVLRAGGLTKDASLEDFELYRTDPATKEIALHKLNLKKAMEGDRDENAYLNDLDRVVIHSIWEKAPKQYLTIKGEVTKPGQFPYAANMRVSDLLFAAGNLLESAYSEAELASHSVIDGELSLVSYKTIDLRRAIAGLDSDNLKLKPYDSLFIKKIPDWRQERFVAVAGEVRFPGRYIIKKGEKISSLIERAGGFTDKSYLKGAVFRRESVRQLQQRNLDEAINRLERMMLSQSSINIEKSVTPEAAKQQEMAMEQKKALIAKMREVKPKGRIVVSLAPAERLRNSPYDILLEDGDSLEVPERSSVVSVSGSIVNPTSFVYDPDVSISSYISKSGGATELADKDGTYVIKADGSSLSPDALNSWGNIDWNEHTKSWEIGSYSAKLEPGDTIVVPEQIERVAWLREIKDVTQILYQIAVTAGVIIVAF